MINKHVCMQFVNKNLAFWKQNRGEMLGQGYSIILRKGPVTNVKIFRGPVTPIKSCKCEMFLIFLTKNVI